MSSPWTVASLFPHVQELSLSPLLRSPASDPPRPSSSSRDRARPGRVPERQGRPPSSCSPVHAASSHAIMSNRSVIVDYVLYTAHRSQSHGSNAKIVVDYVRPCGACQPPVFFPYSDKLRSFLSSPSQILSPAASPR